MGKILGIVAILCGGISGGAVGLGYKLGQGKIDSKKEANTFLWILTLFGLFGVLVGYLGPYLIFASKGFSFSMYFSLIGFDFISLLFIIIGAYGGRWAGSHIARSIILKEAYKEAIEHVKEKTVRKIDNKFK